jgi:Phytanoyl-CoA dioxygenase (PhyH)
MNAGESLGSPEDVLSAADVARFVESGFLPGPVLFGAERLDGIRQAVDDIRTERSLGLANVLVFRRDPVLLDADGDAFSRSQVHVVGPSRAEPLLRELVDDPQVVRAVCQLMGTSQVRFFRDQLFLKPPRVPERARLAGAHSGEVPWHQDYSDWGHTTPPRHITCWVALDDSATPNGCLWYVPASHRGPVFPKPTYFDNMDSVFARLPPDVQQSFAPEPVPVSAGACLFHHCLTIHGSFANQTDLWRRALAITYMHPETRSTSAAVPSVPSGPFFPEGTLLDGSFFPLLPRHP